MNALPRALLFLLSVITLSPGVFAEEATEIAAVAIPTIAAHDAINYIGKTATVCGVVSSSRYLDQTERKLTFLNIDEAHPNQKFDVVIEDADRANYSEAPEVFYKGKKICVTGLIEIFKGKGQIHASKQSQITVTESP